MGYPARGEAGDANADQLVELTLDTYVDPQLVNVAGAVESLPSLDGPGESHEAEPMRATGTGLRQTRPSPRSRELARGLAGGLPERSRRR